MSEYQQKGPKAAIALLTVHINYYYRVSTLHCSFGRELRIPEPWPRGSKGEGLNIWLVVGEKTV